MNPERPRYPRVTLRHQSFGETDSLMLTFSRLEGDQVRSFSLAEPFRGDEVYDQQTIKGMTAAARLLQGECRDKPSTLPMETLMHCAQNMVALARGWRLVPREGCY